MQELRTDKRGWLLLPVAMLLSACSGGGVGGPFPLTGTWRTEIAEYIVEDPLMGTWETNFNYNSDVNVPTTIRVLLDYDGTWSWTETRRYAAAASTQQGCTEALTWSGSFARAAAGMLTFSGSAAGMLARTGCAQPSDNGSSALPGLDGPVTYRTITTGRTAVLYTLTLTLAGQNMGQPQDFNRVDLAQDTLVMTLNADMTWQRTLSRVYAPTALRRAGCTEVTTQSGTYTTRSAVTDASRQNDCVNGSCWSDLTITGTADASVVRSACTAAADNGASTAPAARSLGALGGLHSVRTLSDELQMDIYYEDHTIAFSWRR